MKKVIKIGLLIQILLVVNIYSTEFFSSYGRSTGDGFYAYSLGAESVIYNSAAGLLSETPEVMLEYEDLLKEIRGELNLNRQVFCGVYPYKPNDVVLGGGIFMFNSDVYKESLYKFIAAKNITSYIIKEEEKQKYITISAGLNLKYMSFQYPQNSLLDSDPLFNNGRVKDVISFDLNLLYTLNKIYYFGLSINDIFEPDIGLKETSLLKRKIILSFGYRYLKENFVIIPLLGLRNYLNTTEFSAGCEVVYKENYKIRASYSSWSTAVGIGYEYKNFSLNYSYAIINQLDTSSGHYLSLSYKIGAGEKKNKEEIIKEQKVEQKEQGNKQTIAEVKSASQPEPQKTNTQPKVQKK
jgi:hypothetical protein